MKTCILCKIYALQFYFYYVKLNSYAYLNGTLIWLNWVYECMHIFPYFSFSADTLVVCYKKRWKDCKLYFLYKSITPVLYLRLMVGKHDSYILIPWKSTYTRYVCTCYNYTWESLIIMHTSTLYCLLLLSDRLQFKIAETQNIDSIDWAFAYGWHDPAAMLCSYFSLKVVFHIHL